MERPDKPFVMKIQFKDERQTLVAFSGPEVGWPLRKAEQEIYFLLGPEPTPEEVQAAAILLREEEVFIDAHRKGGLLKVYFSHKVGKLVQTVVLIALEDVARHYPSPEFLGCDVEWIPITVETNE